MSTQTVSEYLASIGRKGGLAGGKSQSEPKAAAARANGAKGGRPRKDGNPKPLTVTVVTKFSNKKIKEWDYDDCACGDEDIPVCKRCIAYENFLHRMGEINRLESKAATKKAEQEKPKAAREVYSTTCLTCGNYDGETLVTIPASYGARNGARIHCTKCGTKASAYNTKKFRALLVGSVAQKIAAKKAEQENPKPPATRSKQNPKPLKAVKKTHTVVIGSDGLKFTECGQQLEFDDFDQLEDYSKEIWVTREHYEEAHKPPALALVDAAPTCGQCQLSRKRVKSSAGLCMTEGCESKRFGDYAFCEPCIREKRPNFEQEDADDPQFIAAKKAEQNPKQELKAASLPLS